MVLTIHVKPNCKVDQIGFDEEGNLKVKIRAQPVDGKANKYLQEYLAGIFNVPKSKVQILKGANSQHKKVEIQASDSDIEEIIHGLKQSS